MSILSFCINEAGFDANIVSNADDVGVIQKRIIQNLYDNPIVICDVSGKNPNVMFELGIRLAFDKPTIVIKDDKTSYSFDTSPLEHIEYPRDLRYNKIEEFKTKFIDKIRSTHKKSTTDEQYSTFLKHFGEFKVAKITTKEVSQEEYIMDELRSLRRLIQQTNRFSSREIDRYDKSERYYSDFNEKVIDICCGDMSFSQLDEIMPMVQNLSGIENVKIESRSEDHQHLIISISSLKRKNQIEEDVRKLIAHLKC